MRRLSDGERQEAATIVALLCAVVHAWAAGDADAESEARADLSKLGVAVVLPVRRASSGGPADD